MIKRSSELRPYLKKLFGNGWQEKSLRLGILILNQFTQAENQTSFYILSFFNSRRSDKKLTLIGELEVNNFTPITDYDRLFAEGFLKARLKRQYPAISDDIERLIPIDRLSSRALSRSELEDVKGTKEECDSLSKEVSRFVEFLKEPNDLPSFETRESSKSKEEIIHNLRVKLANLEEKRDRLYANWDCLRTNCTGDLLDKVKELGFQIATKIVGQAEGIIEKLNYKISEFESIDQLTQQFSI